MGWHYRHNEQEDGPISIAELEDLVRQGKIGLATAVRRVDSAHWFNCGELRMLPDGSILEESWGVWRQGNLLVCRAGVDLPSRCVKCNGDRGFLLRSCRVAWHPPAYYLLLAIWPIYMRVAPQVTVEGQIAVGLCRRHRLLRKSIKAGAFLSGLAGIGLFVWSFLQSWDGALWWLLFAIIAIIYSFAGAQVIRAKRFTKTHVWLTGVVPAYLGQFPDWPGD